MQHGPLKETPDRAYRRLPLLARVTQKSGQTTYWRAVNVSEGGIFVRAAPTLPVGTALQIAFHLPGVAVEIVTRARVVWTNDANSPLFDPTRPFGMGLAFVDLKPEFQRLIRQYVEHSEEIVAWHPQTLRSTPN